VLVWSPRNRAWAALAHATALMPTRAPVLQPRSPPFFFWADHAHLTPPGRSGLYAASAGARSNSRLRGCVHVPSATKVASGGRCGSRSTMRLRPARSCRRGTSASRGEGRTSASPVALAIGRRRVRKGGRWASPAAARSRARTAASLRPARPVRTRLGAAFRLEAARLEAGRHAVGKHEVSRHKVARLEGALAARLVDDCIRGRGRGISRLAKKRASVVPPPHRSERARRRTPARTPRQSSSSRSAHAAHTVAWRHAAKTTHGRTSMHTQHSPPVCTGRAGS